MSLQRLIVLTPERLKKIETPKGGHTKKTVEALGFTKYPPYKGWRRHMYGKLIRLDDFIDAVVGARNYEYLQEIQRLLPTLDPPIHENILKRAMVGASDHDSCQIEIDLVS